MSMTGKLTSTEVTPRAALISIAVLLLVTAGVATLVLNRLKGASTEASRHPARPATHAATASATTAAALTPADYHVIVTRNLFAPEHVTGSALASPPPIPPPPIPPRIVVPPLRIPPPTSAPPKPRLAYTGDIELPTGTFALLETLDTHEAQYCRVGGMAFGWTVQEITPRFVVLDQQGNRVMLNLGENKIEVTESANTNKPPAATNVGTPATATASAASTAGQPPVSAPTASPTVPTAPRQYPGGVRTFRRGVGAN